eukprot:scaffold1174_cov180-Amphora_coffeaeformis.AAC.5
MPVVGDWAFGRPARAVRGQETDWAGHREDTPIPNAYDSWKRDLWRKSLLPPRFLLRNDAILPKLPNPYD